MVISATLVSARKVGAPIAAGSGQEGSDAVFEKEAVVEEGLLSVREAARFLSVSRSTLYELMESGQLHYVKLGRARRIPRRAVLALAARNLRGGWRVDEVA